MKRKYALLAKVIAIELVILSVLSKTGISVQSWIGNAVGAFICLVPIQILLFLFSHDERFSKNVKTFFKSAFWFINACYIVGGVATFVQE